MSYENNDWVSQFSGSKRRKVMKSDKFYYVPLLKSLANMLKLEDIQPEILNPHHTSERNTGTLRPGSHPIASFQGATFYCHNITSEHHRALK